MGALGPGGLLQGGVTAVSTNEVAIVAPVTPFAWSARKESGRIVLSGVAPSKDDQAAVEATARDMFRDADVSSKMVLASGAPSGVNWRLAAIQGLEALQPLLRGDAKLVDHQLTITGVAGSDAAVAEVAEKLRMAQAGVTATSQVTGPPEWTARLADGRLMFSGRVPSGTAQRNLAAAATASFKGAFSDEANVGITGAFANRAVAALPQFAKFKSGEMSVQGRVFIISGEAPESALAYLKEDMKRLNDTYTVNYNVKVLTPEMPELKDMDLAKGDDSERRKSCETAFQRVMTSNKILFSNNAATITRQSAEALDKVAEVGRRCSDFKVEVRGYTDNKGRKAANMKLSANRAEAVRAWLQDKGVPAANLSARGFGPDNPIASNARESGRAQNRRIEFRVTN
jgi:OOP family OmpA-OmpF porin